MSARLRVGVNAVFMLAHRGGMETFVRGLLTGLTTLEDDVAIVLYCPEHAVDAFHREEPWAERIEYVTAPRANVMRRPIRIGSELFWLLGRARRDRLDVLHHTANVGPFVSVVPSVLTIHDLIWRHFPSTAPPLSRVWLRALTPMALRAADRIATVSNHTREDLLSEYRVPPRKVQVIYPGAGREAVPGNAAAARKRYQLGEGPVVLTFGVGFENKNIGTLLEAFSRIGPERDATLVHVGVPVFEGESWRRLAHQLGIADRVRFTGFNGSIDDATVDDLFSAATMVALPSRFEGFGSPLVEAMVRGVPVASSHATSLPEVGGNAAAWFDPLDVGGMAAAIADLLDDPDRRKVLVEAGLKQAGRFSYDRTAREYLDLYQSLARDR